MAIKPLIRSLLPMGIFFCSATAPAIAGMDTPRLKPGEWVYDTTTTVISPFQAPEQHDSYRECLTEDGIRSGEAFIDDGGVCEIQRHDVGRYGMVNVMKCPGQDNSTIHLTTALSFDRDTADGTVVMKTAGSGMSVEVRVEMLGRWIGECPE
jgi:hypothetical protein